MKNYREIGFAGVRNLKRSLTLSLFGSLAFTTFGMIIHSGGGIYDIIFVVLLLTLLGAIIDQIFINISGLILDYVEKYKFIGFVLFPLFAMVFAVWIFTIFVGMKLEEITD